MDPQEEARLRTLASEAGLSVSRVEPLAGDVGTRRYSRLFTGSNETAIAVIYPESARESLRRWNRVREALSGRIRVPRVLAEGGDGVQILEDFGVWPLSRIWSETPRRRSDWLELAADCAAAVAETDDPLANPAFTEEFFRSEMEKSRVAFFSGLARDPLSPAEEAVHDEFASSLAREIAGHPQTFVHRDFHLDNLFETGGEVGVIDFQDARLGPDSYDMASLAFERATLVSPDMGIAEEACRRFERAFPRPPGFGERLRRVSLQRSWKAAGTFARVCADGRGSAYRSFLASQTARVLRLLGEGAAEREFAGILRARSVKLFGQEEVAC
ncbi:MAG: phosphotransferase [Thermoanaerobaculia bacterium]